MLVAMILVGWLSFLPFKSFFAFVVYTIERQAYVLAAELILGFTLRLAVPILLLIFLFRKSQLFPRLFVAWAAICVAFFVVEHFLVVLVSGDTLGTTWSQQLGFGPLRSLFLSVIPVGAFIPYVLKSRRVKNTFVN